MTVYRIGGRAKPPKPPNPLIEAVRAAYHVERERLGKGAAFDAAVSRVRLLAGEQGVKAASRKDAAVAGKFSPFVVQFVARVFPEWPLPKLARRVAKALAAEKCPIFILAKGSELSTVCSDVGNEVKMQDTATATDLLRHLGESLAALGDADHRLYGAASTFAALAQEAKWPQAAIERELALCGYVLLPDAVPPITSLVPPELALEMQRIGADARAVLAKLRAAGIDVDALDGPTVQ